MAKGLFTTFPLAEVLAIQAKAKALVLEGKTLMGYADSGTSATRSFSMPPAEVLEECDYALRLLDPTMYGPAVARRTYGPNLGRTAFTH